MMLSARGNTTLLIWWCLALRWFLLVYWGTRQLQAVPRGKIIQGQDNIVTAGEINQMLQRQLHLSLIIFLTFVRTFTRSLHKTHRNRFSQYLCAK